MFFIYHKPIRDDWDDENKFESIVEPIKTFKDWDAVGLSNEILLVGQLAWVRTRSFQAYL